MWKSEQFAWLGENRENRYSQFGEDSIIEKIFSRIGTLNKWCCECGAADGIFFSNTRKLIEEGWSSLQIEADEKQFEKLADLYRNVPSVTCYNYKVQTSGAFSFDRLLSKVGAPFDPDLLVIDVDGEDYWLANSLISHRPRVLMVEYAPGVELGDQTFIAEAGSGGQSGLNATIRLLIGKYYWPVAITQTNVIAVQQELCGKLVDDQVLECFARGNSLNHLPECGTSYRGCAPTCPKDQAETEKDKYWQYCLVCGSSFTPSADWLVCSRTCSISAIEQGLPTRQRDRKINPPLGCSVIDETVEAATISAPKVAAVMSTPRVGPLATMDAIFQGLAPFNIPLLRGEGAYWHQSLTRCIERAVNEGAELILTFDYDTVFQSKATNNDIAKLVCLMIDHPEVDVIVSAQMKREGGALLATTEQEVRLFDPLIPITQGHFGLTIFRRSVFERLPKPWLRDTPNESGEWNENRIDADIHFWKQCVEAGINVQMSLDVMIGHLEWVVTWPSQNLIDKPVYQPLNDWRDHGKPVEAFDRQRVIDAVKANPALLYGAKLNMGD